MKDSKLLKIIDFDKVNEYESLRKMNWVGFAEIYLDRCEEESKSIDEIEKKIYTKCVNLDRRLGTTITEQLFGSVSRTLNLDIIKV